MPALPTLIIEDSSGTTKETLAGVTASRTETLVGASTQRDTADYATVRVDRDAWTDVYPSNVDEINDTFRVERGDGSLLFAGRFADDARDGDTIDVQIDSFERDAIDAEPTDAREIYQNVNDSTVFTDAINDVPTLTTGTVETGASSVSFTFANASQAKKVRDAARPDGQDVVYNPDTTVDFLDRRGADKSHIAISNTNDTVVGELTVEDNSRNPVTHIRGLGAQQGGEQVTAQAVVSSYTQGDRKVWRRYVNKDIVEQNRLQAVVDRLASIYDSGTRRLFVEATLRNVNVGIGDSVTVDLPDHDINQTMRIIEITEQLTNAGQRWLARLSNRTPERGGRRKQQDDLDRFNSGDQGFVDRDTDSYGWQPVSSSVNARRPYPYPDDVVREDVAEVTINSIPYRAFSQGAASGGQHTHTVSVTHPSHDHDVTHPSHAHDVTHPQHSHDVSINTTTASGAGDVANANPLDQAQTLDDGQTFSDRFNLPFVNGDGAFAYVYFSVQLKGTDVNGTGVTGGGDVRIVNTDTNTALQPFENSATSYLPADFRLYQASEAGDVEGDEIEVRFDCIAPNDGLTYRFSYGGIVYAQHTHGVSTTETSDARLGTTETSTTALGVNETSTTALGTTVDETSTADGDHTHDPQPGIIDFPTETASNVNLIVNGTTVATDINSGTFTETVDISGQLTPGDNTIELSSDTLGLVNLSVETQLFRSGGPAP